MRDKKKTLRFLFVAALIGIIIYTFRGSWGEIFIQLADTSLMTLGMVISATIIYHLLEAWITWSLAREYRADFPYRAALYCAFYCSFYRLSTLGSGAGVAAVVFLGKRGVGYTEATGLYMAQYILHKASIALFSGIFFLLNWQLMVTHYRRFAFFLVVAYVITALISVGLILLAVCPAFHWLILVLVRKLNRRNRLDNAILKLEKNAKIMEEATSRLMKNRKKMLSCVGKNLVKLCFWYAIPFLLLGNPEQISLLTSCSVTSLSVMAATVVPTPAGIGSTEWVMAALFRQLTEVSHAAAITLLYRVATFLFPGLVGGGCILLEKALRRHALVKKQEKM